MADTKPDIILHPVRMRIIQTLISSKQLTAQQIHEQLADVPQATLYRHLKKLADANVLVVVAEIPNRGTLEKVYELQENGANISEEALKQASAEEHLAYFMSYAAHMIGEYGNYVQQPGFDLFRDGVSYRAASLYLSDEENLELLMGIKALITQALHNKPAAHRRRRAISITGFPLEARSKMDCDRRQRVRKTE